MISSDVLFRTLRDQPSVLLVRAHKHIALIDFRDIAVVLEILLLAQVHRAITHLNLILGHSNLQLKFSTFILHRHVAFV